MIKLAIECIGALVSIVQYCDRVVNVALEGVNTFFDWVWSEIIFLHVSFWHKADPNFHLLKQALYLKFEEPTTTPLTQSSVAEYQAPHRPTHRCPQGLLPGGSVPLNGAA